MKSDCLMFYMRFQQLYCTQTSTIRGIMKIICKAHLENDILLAQLSKTILNLIIYKGRHIFFHFGMPGIFSGCGPETVYILEDTGPLMFVDF